MTISSLLNIGSRAMNASYAQLTVTGNNIANANTAGYSRQSVELETAFKFNDAVLRHLVVGMDAAVTEPSPMARGEEEEAERRRERDMDDGEGFRE